MFDYDSYYDGVDLDYGDNDNEDMWNYKVFGLHGHKWEEIYHSDSYYEADEVALDHCEDGYYRATKVVSYIGGEETLIAEF